jgi:hypothetical protein
MGQRREGGREGGKEGNVPNPGVSFLDPAGDEGVQSKGLLEDGAGRALQ